MRFFDLFVAAGENLHAAATRLHEMVSTYENINEHVTEIRGAGLFVGSGTVLTGHTTALNGTTGNRPLWPVVMVSDVPDAAGVGTV